MGLLDDHRLIESVKAHEGFESRVYRDIRDIPTIGYGTRIDEIELDERTAGRWLVSELQEKIERLEHVAGWERMAPARQAVVLEMAYWMGVGGVLRFRRMWVAIRADDWKSAAVEMRDSRTWRNEKLRPRMETLARRMELGAWEVGEDS